MTINTGTAVNISFTSNNGFASANPLSGPSDLGFTGSFTDAGPDDHGALFDFNFGMLAPGATKEFKIFYGAAANEMEANASLEAVGAEAFSFGQPNTADGPTLGIPNTFVFAFAGVDGTLTPRNVKIAVILAEPSDDPHNTTHDKNYYLTKIIPDLKDYYREVSYGAVNIVINQEDVYDNNSNWYKLGKTGTYYGGF